MVEKVVRMNLLVWVGLFASQFSARVWLIK